MSVSNEQLLKAIQTIESQLAILKQAAGESGQEEGVVGTFDGEFMTLEDNRRFPIPPNYASKSMLVPGDTLRMVEDTSGNGQHRFKQIAKVERAKATGLLTRKDGKFEVICEDGSFKVLTAAVKHFEAQPGDSAVIQFAKNHTKGSWAAIEKVTHASAGPQAATIQHQPSAEPVVVAEAPTVEAAAPVAVAPAAQPAVEVNMPKAPSQSNKSVSKPKGNSNKTNRPQSSSKPQPSNKPATSHQPQPAPAAKPAAPVAGPTISGEIDLTQPADEDDLI